MPRLPQPTTTSPGFLQLKYTANGISHKISQRLISGVDPTDVTIMAAEAQTWAGVLGPAMGNTCHITDYAVLNPSRIELYANPLTTPITGTYTPAGGVASESFTFDLVGRGIPGGGLAQGNTRHQWFPGIFDATLNTASVLASAVGTVPAILTFLNANTVIGADVYGTKALYANKIDLQFNAHFQKRYGL